MPVLIQADNIVKTYGRGEAEFRALRGVDFAIDEGESVAIVGKSGSGKSTLMHILALMDKPSAGTLTVQGKDASKLSKKELDQVRNQLFGFVFQQFFLNARESVLENVVLPLKIAGVGKKERQAKAMEVLASVGLEDKAKNRANDLSGGQKQRVVIARALVNDAAVLLCDEPTGNLDTTTGEAVEDILFDLHRSKGTTLIIVTHDPELAQRCERQVHIKDGEIVAAEDF